MSAGGPSIAVRSYAKLNLGLEVLGKRDDGYHEIVTILQQVDIHDEFTWHATGMPFEYISPAAIDPGRDLVRRALEFARDRDRWSGTLTLQKRVPVGAGMGGGSSNAATALRLARPGASADELLECARQLGSDVPFFLRGGTALATGTGTSLQVLPTPKLWFVITVPDVTIEDKTSAMYRRLTSDDYSDGSRVLEAAQAIRTDAELSGQLPNAFRRHYQGTAEVERAFRLLCDVGCAARLSGAGPTVFAVFSTRADAVDARREMPEDLGQIYVTSSLGEGDDQAVAAMAQSLRGTISG
jgi:4-diphosphocytidyl-2-C-methyl-D-erythritol kinase